MAIYILKRGSEFCFDVDIVGLPESLSTTEHEHRECTSKGATAMSGTTGGFRFVVLEVSDIEMVQKFGCMANIFEPAIE